MRTRSTTDPIPTRSMVMGVSVLVVAGLYLAQAVLIPITLSILLSFLLNPLVRRLKRWGVGHTLAVAIVGFIALLVVLVLTGLFTLQVANLISELPEYSRGIRDKLQVVWEPIQEYLGRAQKSVVEFSDSAAAAASPTADAIPVVEVGRRNEVVTSWLMTLTAPVGVFAVVIVLAGAMLLQGADLRDRIVRLVGYSRVSVTTQALDDVGERVSAYLLAQTILNASQGTAIAIGLLLIGVPNAIFFAIIWAILRFLPYVGPWLGAIFPVLTAFGHFEGLRDPILTVTLFVVVELIGNMILEPWFYGRRTGLSPLAVIVSAVFWTWLWGWVGLLLATPMTVCLAVLGKYVEPLEFLHVLLGDEPVLRPSTRLYQRLLARQPQEALAIITEELEHRGTLEVFQNTIVRALASVEDDRLKGLIDDDKAHEAFAAVQDILEEIPEPTDLPEKITTIGTVCCIPARDEADVLCGKLLQILCKHRGVDVTLVNSGYLASEKAEQVIRHAPDVVLVSALSTSRVPYVRHALRSIAARKDIPLVVGIWSGDADISQIAADHGAVAAGSFPEAMDALLLAIHAQTQILRPKRAPAIARKEPDSEPAIVKSASSAFQAR